MIEKIIFCVELSMSLVLMGVFLHLSFSFEIDHPGFGWSIFGFIACTVMAWCIAINHIYEEEE